MRKALLITIISHLASFAMCQDAGRVYLPGTRISITNPPNVLIPKHTSTLFIDGKIEFATIEFPNMDNLKDHMSTDMLISDEVISEQIEIQIGKHKGTVQLSNYGPSHQLFQSYFGDSTFAVLSQCIYKNSLVGFKERLIDIMKSMKIDESPTIDMESYLSYTYDTTSIFKLISKKYIVETMFTPNGIINDSLFAKTNISSLQFPPAPQVTSSMELMFGGISGPMSTVKVQKVLFDGEIDLNGQKAYKFNALCERNGQKFEIYAMAIYDSKSSVFISCNIINEEYKDEVYSFFDSIKLKMDGY